MSPEKATQKKFVTIYNGLDIYAVEVDSDDSAWEEGKDEAPKGTSEERFSYIRYLAHHARNYTFSEEIVTPYISRICELADTEIPFKIPVEDGEAKLKRAQAENDAYLLKGLGLG